MSALSLSSLVPELLARTVAALPSVADVCRADCVSRLFRGSAPGSVVEEALRLRHLLLPFAHPRPREARRRQQASS